MTSRDSFARSQYTGRSERASVRQVDHLANVPLYATAALCVLTTVFVLWLQAGRSDAPQFSETEPALQPSAESSLQAKAVETPVLAMAPPNQTEPQNMVARAASVAPLPTVPVLQKSSEPVSHQLRRPIRLIQTDQRVYDLRALAADALSSFGHSVSDEDRLHVMLVAMLSEGQSDEYIDAALNAARVRGEFATPKALITVSGKIDTQSLLTSLLMLSHGAQTQAEPLTKDHVLSASDSLAGLALRYYGQPAAFQAILRANTPLQQGMNIALSGARIELPTL